MNVSGTVTFDDNPLCSFGKPGGGLSQLKSESPPDSSVARPLFCHMHVMTVYQFIYPTVDLNALTYTDNNIQSVACFGISLK